MNPASATDVVFFVSGSTSAKDTTERGVAVFAGDVVASGSIHVGPTSKATKAAAVNIVHDFATKTFQKQMADGEGGGTVLRYGFSGSPTTVGTMYYMGSMGSWSQADSTPSGFGIDKAGGVLLGIALGTSPSVDGMLLEGFVRISSSYVQGTPSISGPVYVSDTAGSFDFTAPTTSGDIVRVVGYCIDTAGSDILLYFRPANTWVELS